LRIAITDSFSNIILFRVAEMEFQKEDKLSAAGDGAKVLENGNVSNIPNGQPILNGATSVEAKGSLSADSSVGSVGTTASASSSNVTVSSVGATASDSSESVIGQDVLTICSLIEKSGLCGPPEGASRPGTATGTPPARPNTAEKQQRPSTAGSASGDAPSAASVSGGTPKSGATKKAPASRTPIANGDMKPKGILICFLEDELHNILLLSSYA
jgi:hypothetical protein